MQENELLALIRNGENSGVEFKRDDILPVTGTSPKSMDWERIENYFETILKLDVPAKFSLTIIYSYAIFYLKSLLPDF